MAVMLGGHLLLAPAPIAARAVATMLSLVLVRLTQAGQWWVRLNLRGLTAPSLPR
jgi:hypothetical protein